MAERRKIDSCDQEIIRANDKINQLMEEKTKSCRVKAQFEKLYKCLDKMEEKERQIVSKWETNYKLKKPTTKNPQRYTKTSSEKLKSILTILARPK